MEKTFYLIIIYFPKIFLNNNLEDGSLVNLMIVPKKFDLIFIKPSKPGIVSFADTEVLSLLLEKESLISGK
jgi:hypothetical protein